MDRGNNRLLAGLHEVHEVTRHWIDRPIGGVELPDIGATAEVTALTAKDNYFHRRIVFSVRHQFGDLKPHLLRKRVDWRVIYGNHTY